MAECSYYANLLADAVDAVMVSGSQWANVKHSLPICLCATVIAWKAKRYNWKRNLYNKKLNDFAIENRLRQFVFAAKSSLAYKFVSQNLDSKFFKK